MAVLALLAMQPDVLLREAPSPDHVSFSLPPPLYPFSCLASTGTNANSYNAWPPFVLKAHGVNHIPLVSELDIKSYTGYPPGNEIRVSPPIGATCQKLRTEGPHSGGSLLFMTTAWQHHESVMRTPPWRRDQAQSPEIAMKYSIVFTHRNLFPRKRTKQQGCERCGSWDLSPAASWPDGRGRPRARQWGERERQTNQRNQSPVKPALVKPDCWRFGNLMAWRNAVKIICILIIYVRSLNILIMWFS